MVRRILKSRVMPWVSLTVGILLSMFILVLLVLNTDFFAYSIGRMFSRYFFVGSPFSISVEKLQGNPLRELRARNVRIRYQGEDLAFDLFRVDEIHLNFDILSLIRKGHRLDEVVLVNPHLWMKTDSTGVFILPSAAGDGGFGWPEFTIKGFAVRSGQLIVQGPGKADVVKDINLRGDLSSSGKEMTFRFHEGAAENLGRSIVLRNLRGMAGVAVDGAGPAGREPGRTRIFIEDLTVGLEESEFSVSGTIMPDSSAFDLVIRAEQLEIEELARALDYETVQFGELQGTVVASGTAESLRVAGTLNGVLSGYSLNDFSFDATRERDRVRIGGLEGRLNGAWVEGGGFYSPGEAGKLSLDLAVRELDLSAGLLPDRDMPETMFDGRIIADYRLEDGRLDFTVDLGRGHFRHFPFDRMQARCSYTGDSLHIEEARISHPQHDVDFHGSYTDDGRVKFYFDLVCDRDDTLFSYFDIEDYRADLRMNAIWQGSLDSWKMNASSAFEDFTYGSVLVTRGELNLAISMDGGASVSFDIEGDSCSVHGFGFSDPELSLEYAEGVTRLKRMHLSGSSYGADVVAEIESREEETVIRVGELLLDALGEKWVGGGESTISIKDTLTEFHDFQLHSRQGAAYLDGAIKRPSNEVGGELGFERLELGLLNTAGLVSVPLSGKGAGRIELSGSLDDPDVAVDMLFERGGIDTIVFEAFKFAARYSGGRHILDSLSVSTPAGYITVSGEVSGAPMRELLRDPGEILGNATADLESRCVGLSLQPILALTGKLPFAGGVFTGSALLSGSLTHPAVMLQGNLEELGAASFKIPSMNLTANLSGDELRLDGTLGLLAEHAGRFRGSLPLEREDWFYSMDLERPIALKLEIPEGDLGIFPGITDRFAEAGGMFSANFEVSGTTERPDILGEFKLIGARFRLAGMEENFYEVDSRIILDDTLVTVEQLRGREGGKGKFQCSGWMSLRGWKPGSYNLSIEAEEFLVVSIPDIIAVLEGRLLVNSREEGGKVIPVLTGSLEAKKAEVFYDIGDFASTEQKSTMAPPSWEAAIELDVPGNTWLKTPDANVELLGNVTIYHDRRGTYMRGELSLLRGWYNVYNNKFRIRSGKLNFVHAGGFRPVVNIEAETRAPEGRKIYLDLAWHQDDVEPRLMLRHEDPGYSETDVWKMLGGGVVGSPDDEAASWDALSTAQNIAANYIERVLNSQMEGLTIELESGGSSSLSGRLEESETMIAVGKYLSESIYVKYKQGLSISTARQIEMEYRISNLFLLRSEIIRHSERVLRGKSPRSSDEINIDLKLRWEF